MPAASSSPAVILKTTARAHATGGDTYTLEVSSGNGTWVLAENCSISEIPSQPYIITLNETTVIPRLDPHDIGITQFITSKTVVGQNFSLPSSTSIFNYGNNTETFNITVYANTTIIATFTNVTLASGNSMTCNFSWDTTGFARGNYTISVVADPVAGEVYTADNTVIGGWVLVTIPGDVEGDRDIDIFDIVLMGGGYGEPPRGVYMNCDIDGDGDIDIFDIVVAGIHYGESW